MSEKRSKRNGFELLFKSFEKRQNGKFKALEERVIHQFHIISESLIDQIKLLAEGHHGIIERLSRMDNENERQHLETRSLIKISFSEMDRRISELELQLKEIQEWKKQVQERLQI